MSGQSDKIREAVEPALYTMERHRLMLSRARAEPQVFFASHALQRILYDLQIHGRRGAADAQRIHDEMAIIYRRMVRDVV